MNFVQLRAFHAVANHGSFSAAAQFLGVSQPAVTVQIKALEETLGARLFHRGGSTVELTEMPRCFSSSIQSEVVARWFLRAVTEPASATAPP